MTRSSTICITMSIACEAISVRIVDGCLEVTAALPIYARSEANSREHRMVRARRAAEQRGTTSLMLGLAKSGMKQVLDAGGVLTVKLTRVRPKRAAELDDDNLRPSLKAVRDGVADAAGLSDNHKQLKWVYAQAVGDDYAVRIEITGGPR